MNVTTFEISSLNIWFLVGVRIQNFWRFFLLWMEFSGSMVLFLVSIKNWMGSNPNGPRSVSCDRAIRYSGFFGVREKWVLLEISWMVGSVVGFCSRDFLHHAVSNHLRLHGELAAFWYRWPHEAQEQWPRAPGYLLYIYIWSNYSDLTRPHLKR